MKKYDKMNDEQQRRYITSNLKESMFVEAGAGAGKTSLIVKRIIMQLKDGIPPNRIAAITFTNAASEELRNRILTELKTQSEQGEDKNLNSALKDIESMKISTIHSFCADILRESCLQAQLPIGFKILNPKEAQKRKDELFEMWFNTLKESDINEIYKLSDNKKKTACKQCVKENFQKLLSVPAFYKIYGSKEEDFADTEETIHRILKEAEEKIQELFQKKEAWLKKAKELVGSDDPIRKEEDGNLNERWKNLNRTHEKYLNLPKNKALCFEDTSMLFAMLKKANPTDKEPYFKNLVRDFSVKENQKTMKGHLITVKAEFESIKEALKDIIQEQEEYKNYFKARIALKYALMAMEFFQKNVKNDEIDNDQLLEKTYNLLDMNVPTIYHNHNKYDCIYVDEFQDTDPLQESILRNIATNRMEKNLNKGKLFVVGDPKQAIYRFRGADPTIYFDVKEKFENSKYADVFQLSLNFRSNSKITDYINADFEHSDLLGKSQSYVKMTSPPSCEIKEKLNDRELAGQYQIRFFKKGINNEEKLDLEDSLAHTIQYLVENKFKIRNRNSEKGKFREVKYSDFMILFEKHRGMAKYIKGFERIGVKTQVFGEISLSEEPSLKNFLKYYKFLSNPYSHRYRMGIVELLKHKLRLKFFDLKEEELLTKVQEIMDEMLEDVKSMNSYAKACYLLDQFDLMFNEEESNSHATISVQTKLQQMIETIFSQSEMNEVKLIQEIEDYIAHHLDREILLENHEDVVKIINYHKAKGLEANIVILMPKGASRQMGADYRKDQCFYPNIQLLGYSKYFIANKKIEDEAISQNNYEKMRLEYVAKTRAKEALIMLCDNINPLTADFIPSEGGEKNDIDIDAGDFYFHFAEDFDQTEFKRPERHFDESYAPIYEKFNPSQFEKNSSTRSHHLELAKNGGTLYQMTKDKDRPSGNILGTALHRAMELFVSKMLICKSENQSMKKFMRHVYTCALQAVNESKEEIEKGLNWEQSEVLSQQYIDFIKKVILTTKDYLNETIFKAEGIVSVLTELPFSYYEDEISDKLEEIEKSIFKPAEDFNITKKKSVWVNGTADLLILKEDEAIIIDYKSDLADYIENREDFEKSLEEKYRGQLLLYRYSIHKLYEIPMENIHLHILYFKDYGEGLKAFCKMIDR